DRPRPPTSRPPRPRLLRARDAHVRLPPVQALPRRHRIDPPCLSQSPAPEGLARARGGRRAPDRRRPRPWLLQPQPFHRVLPPPVRDDALGGAVAPIRVPRRSASAGRARHIGAVEDGLPGAALVGGSLPE